MALEGSAPTPVSKSVPLLFPQCPVPGSRPSPGGAAWPPLPARPSWDTSFGPQGQPLRPRSRARSRAVRPSLRPSHGSGPRAGSGGGGRGGGGCGGAVPASAPTAAPRLAGAQEREALPRPLPPRCSAPQAAPPLPLGFRLPEPLPFLGPLTVSLLLSLLLSLLPAAVTTPCPLDLASIPSPPRPLPPSLSSPLILALVPAGSLGLGS